MWEKLRLAAGDLYCIHLSMKDEVTEYALIMNVFSTKKKMDYETHQKCISSGKQNRNSRHFHLPLRRFCRICLYVEQQLIQETEGKNKEIKENRDETDFQTVCGVLPSFSLMTSVKRIYQRIKQKVGKKKENRNGIAFQI